MDFMTRFPLAALSLATLLAGASAISPVPAFAQDGAPAAEVPALPAIRVIAAARRELVETLTVNGTIVPRDEAAAGTDLNGMIVLALNADQGDMVRKGDVLAVLDRSMLDTELLQMSATRAQSEATVDQMRAQISDVRISLKQANEAYDRAVALQKKGVATKAELDNAVNAVDSAKAKLDSAEKALIASNAQLAVVDAQADGVRVQLNKTEIRAPADGLVLARNATLGGVVSSSSAALFRIAIGGEFELEANIAETWLPRLEKGMKTDVILPGSADRIAGAIRRISPEIDQKSRLGPIRVTLAKDTRARAGSFARGVIELQRRDGIAVPVAAVIYKGAEAFLQVVESGQVRTAPVRLGARTADSVEILSGVAEGEDVVARAGTFVADGDKVMPVRDDATGAIKP